MMHFLKRIKRRLRRWWSDFDTWFETACAAARKGLRRGGRKLVDWWRLRRFRLLLRSVPALAALGVVAVAMWLSFFSRNTNDVAAAYKQYADRNLAAGNHAAALIGFQRLMQLDFQDPATAYGLAISLDNTGQKERALVLMDRLAPTDRLGYGPAHLWVAKKRASRGGIPLQSLETHLRFAYSAHPEDREVNALLGRLYLDMKRPAEAEVHLSVAAQVSTEYRLLLARAYALQGKRALLDIEAGRIIASAKASAFTSPEVPAHRFLWAEALMLKRDFSAAEAVLADGLLRPHAEKYRRPLAICYVAWYMHLAQNEKTATLGDRLTVLQRGLAVDPDCPEVIMALYTAMQADKTGADKIRTLLTKELAAGKAVSSIHFVLGFDALEHADLKAAKTHFEIAYQLEPRMAIAANNVAWLMAFGPTPDLPRALATINALIERFPNEPRFRGTRGHILAKKGEYQPALVDLLKALPVYGETPELHERLAEVYSQMGLESSAAVHRSLAKEKKSR